MTILAASLKIFLRIWRYQHQFQKHDIHAVHQSVHLSVCFMAFTLKDPWLTVEIANVKEFLQLLD